MRDGGMLLTIDCDWAVTPTPLKDDGHHPQAAEPETTFEHVRYAYADRPHDDRHGMSTTPAALVAALRARGLPAATRAAFSERHGGVREAWADVLDRAEHVVCLDAHLDMYAIGSLALTVAGPRGRRLRVEYDPLYREMAAGVPSLGHAGPTVAAWAREAAWEEAWALLLLERMPWLERFTWVVPDHFGAGLAAGFPYPHARWLGTLEAARRRGVWRYRLDPAAHRIELEFLEPELAGRRLTVDIVTLDRCPSLAAVDARRLHVCRSPGFLHPAADGWVEELVGRLN